MVKSHACVFSAVLSTLQPPGAVLLVALRDAGIFLHAERQNLLLSCLCCQMWFSCRIGPCILLQPCPHFWAGWLPSTPHCRQCVPLSWQSTAFGLQPNLGEWFPVLLSLGLTQECLSAAQISCGKLNLCLVPANNKDLATGWEGTSPVAGDISNSKVPLVI